MGKEKKDEYEETHFDYQPLPGAKGRGAGRYQVDDPGLGRDIIESAQVGGLNRTDFERQRKAAQARRDERRRGR